MLSIFNELGIPSFPLRLSLRRRQSKVKKHQQLGRLLIPWSACLTNMRTRVWSFRTHVKKSCHMLSIPSVVIWNLWIPENLPVWQSSGQARCPVLKKSWQGPKDQYLRLPSNSHSPRTQIPTARRCLNKMCYDSHGLKTERLGYQISCFYYCWP